MSRQSPSVETASLVRAAVEILVFAPLGFGALIIEDSPAAIDRARRELSNARFLGRFALDRGVAEVRGRLEVSSAERPESAAPASPARPDSGPVGSPPDAVESTADRDAPSPHDLALPDYDTLPAIDIVAKLEALSRDERDAIRRYESAHRQRRTVLGKLSQLVER
jgi:hypothetical protein